MSTIEKQKSRGGGNPLLSSLIEKSKQISAMGMVGIVALILTTSIIVAPITNWVLSISRSVGESNSRLEAVTVSQSEWERLQHMSLNELRSNKTALATPYKVGEDYQVKVNLGTEGYFSGGKCGNIPSGKTANCFKDTTITVFNSDGDRLFSSRQLPLQVGLYTTEEIDSKFTAESTARANKDNNLQTQIDNLQSQINTLKSQVNSLSSKFGNYYTKAEIDKKFEENGTGLVSKDYLVISGNKDIGCPVSGHIQRETYIGNYLLSTQTPTSFGCLSNPTTYKGHSIKYVYNFNVDIYFDGNRIGVLYQMGTPNAVKYLVETNKI